MKNIYYEMLKEHGEKLRKQAILDEIRESLSEAEKKAHSDYDTAWELYFNYCDSVDKNISVPF